MNKENNIGYVSLARCIQLGEGELPSPLDDLIAYHRSPRADVKPPDPSNKESEHCTGKSGELRYAKLPDL